MISFFIVILFIVVGIFYFYISKKEDELLKAKNKELDEIRKKYKNSEKINLKELKYFDENDLKELFDGIDKLF